MKRFCVLLTLMILSVSTVSAICGSHKNSWGIRTASTGTYYYGDEGDDAGGAYYHTFVDRVSSTYVATVKVRATNSQIWKTATYSAGQSGCVDDYSSWESSTHGHDYSAYSILPRRIIQE